MRPSFDLIVATILFVSSALGAVAVYEYRVQPPRNVKGVLQEIREGEHSLLLTHKGGCVGEFRYSLAPFEETLRVKGEGVLRAVYSGQQMPIQGELEVNFTRLGQLSDVTVRVSVGSEKFQLATTGISPIVGVIKGDRVRREFSLPGPVEISKNEDGSWRVHLESLPMSGLPISEQPLIRQYGVEVADSSTTVCLQKESYDLSRLAALAAAAGTFISGERR